MDCLKRLFIMTCLWTCLNCTSGQLLEGIYCGKDNCYDVLKVSREATKSEIAKSYRQLAKIYHPDLHKGEAAKKEAEEMFKTIATAYEILKDEEARNDYDYMLDNPNEYYAHYYRYYRRRVAPKVDVRVVIFVTISIVSAIQYYSAWQRYDIAINYFMTVPKYRNNAMQIAKDEGLLDDKKQNRGKDKSEIKKLQENIVRKIIEDKMDIKGAYAKPKIVDILWIQLIMSPYTLVMYVVWYVTWIIKFNILKQPYSNEEKLYLIRKFLKMKQYTFDGVEDHVKEQYLKKELWIKENFENWKQDKEEEEKKALAENSKHKMYRRYLKNHGIGRMTFEDS